LISISDFQEGKINHVGVENIDGQTIKQKHDILGQRRGVHSGDPPPPPPTPLFHENFQPKGVFSPHPYNLL
jgi:hypothetical protein